MNNDKFNILENYHENGFLAYTASYRHIARQCFLNEKTVKKIIVKFAEAGVILIDTVKNEGGKRPQNVYILGTWKEENGQRSEHYFVDSIFASE
jgi:hypothetical protein